LIEIKEALDWRSSTTLISNQRNLNGEPVCFAVYTAPLSAAPRPTLGSKSGPKVVEELEELLLLRTRHENVVHFANDEGETKRPRPACYS